ncbi:HAMP domain-containing sensor histidine kinase [Bacillus sp. 165]|uniref:sensor histidine kinase n=1 Tax=Bacillus sp. 165 TaxID=1529117 RepID=UPI001ADACAF3|nr:HAMP domain-containing histidine kinase [Bacillus sp. 165]
MKRKSIVLKLFLLTSCLFTLVFLLFFAGQSLFLEKFYIKKKTDNVMHAFETFVEDYEKSDHSLTTIQKLRRKFFTKTNAQLGFLDQNGTIKNVNNYYIDVQDKKTNKIYTVPLNNLLSPGEFTAFMKLSIRENDRILIDGIPKQEIVIPLEITSNFGNWKNENVISDISFFNDKAKKYVQKNPYSVLIDGTVVKKKLPTWEEVNTASDTDTLLQAIQYWVLSVSVGEADPTALTTFKYGSKGGGTNQMFVQPIIKDGEITEFAFAMTSLQPVNEAILVLKDYYVYAFFIVFGVIILLSFYYSKMIAKPLIKINEVTKKIAAFDFSQKLPVVANDEIGSLSNSINTLSTNLKDQINQLQIANQQLIQDVERERQLERTRKEFISGVSHELKTPLSVIHSFAEGIKDGVSTNIDYYTDVILEEADKMNSLIIEMLELAKLESGTYKLSKETFCIDELIRQVMAKLAFSIEEKQLTVLIQTDEKMLVHANKNRIEQVIVNLLSNAIRYTPKQESITVSVHDYGSQIMVSIYNKGTAIPEESLDKIWERFYRTDSSRSRVTGGTGLGLSIVKNILDLHNVKYGVQNRNDGVQFYFYLHKAKKHAD